MATIEKSAATAMAEIQKSRTAAVKVKHETERLAYCEVPDGPHREALLLLNQRAADVIGILNSAENELANVVQAIRKGDAKPTPAVAGKVPA